MTDKQFLAFLEKNTFKVCIGENLELAGIKLYKTRRGSVALGFAYDPEKTNDVWKAIYTSARLRIRFKLDKQLNEYQLVVGMIVARIVRRAQKLFTCRHAAYIYRGDGTSAEGTLFVLHVETSYLQYNLFNNTVKLDLRRLGKNQAVVRRQLIRLKDFCQSIGGLHEYARRIGVDIPGQS